MTTSVLNVAITEKSGQKTYNAITFSFDKKGTSIELKLIYIKDRENR